MHEASVGASPYGPFGGSLVAGDSDQDGLPDDQDSCPLAITAPRFHACNCAAMDLSPGNDLQPECKARERVVEMLIDPNDGIFVVHMALAVVRNGALDRKSVV